MVGNLSSQDDPKISNQYWLDYIQYYSISDKIEIFGDLSYRINEVEYQKTLVVRPSLKWQITPSVSVLGGLGFFQNVQPETGNFLEVRPWQGIRIGWPNIGPLQFKNYIRFEERIDPEENYLSYRARYRIGTKIPINKKIVQYKTLYIPVSMEWLAESDDKFETIWASQSRLMIGLGYVMSREWQFQFEYMNWWNRQSPEEKLEHDQQVFRLSFIKNGWVSGE